MPVRRNRMDALHSLGHGGGVQVDPRGATATKRHGGSRRVFPCKPEGPTWRLPERSLA